MLNNQFFLLKTKRFCPLLLTQIILNYNLNFFKSSIVILMTFVLLTDSEIRPEIIITLVTGFIMLPSLLFSSLAGDFADKYEKSFIIKIIKFLELIMAFIVAYAFYSKNEIILFAIIFMYGTLGAVFGTVKLSILPDHLKKDELIAGNGLLGAGSFLSILLGAISGNVLIMLESGTLIVSSIIIALSIIGFIASLFIPKSSVDSSRIKINYNIIAETYKIIRFAFHNKRIFWPILGIGWFYFLGASFVSQFPIYTKQVLLGNGEVVALLFAAFSFGVVTGSLLCNTILKGKISLKYAPVTLILLTVFFIDLYFANNYPEVEAEVYIGVLEFLNNISNLRVLFDLFMIAICGGVFIVPLYASLQANSEHRHRSRNMAANNLVETIFIISSGLAIIAMYALGLNVKQVLLAIAILSAIVSFVTFIRIKKN